MGLLIASAVTMVACNKNDGGGSPAAPPPQLSPAAPAVAPAGYAATPQPCNVSKYWTGTCPSQNMTMPGTWSYGAWSFPAQWDPMAAGAGYCGCGPVNINGQLVAQTPVYFPANGSIACAPSAYFRNPLFVQNIAAPDYGIPVGIDPSGSGYGSSYYGSAYGYGGSYSGGYDPYYGGGYGGYAGGDLYSALYGAAAAVAYGGSYGQPVGGGYYTDPYAQAYGQPVAALPAPTTTTTQQYLRVSDPTALQCLVRMPVGCDTVLEQTLNQRGGSQCAGGRCIPVASSPSTIGYCSSY